MKKWAQVVWPTAFVAVFTLVLVFGGLHPNVAESVTKVVAYLTETQTISNKTFDNSNLYDGGTFTSPTIASASFSGPTLTGSVTFSGLTANTLPYLNGSKVLTSAALLNGQLLIGSTGAVPAIAGLTGTANQITVTNGPGTITLSTPQSIGTGNSPTFTGLTLSGVTPNALLATDANSIVGPLARAILVGEGGTGLTSAPANGQLPIGNGADYTLGTLTAGGGIQVTNTAGAITLGAIERGHLDGLTLTTPGTSSTMALSAGQATDSTHTAVITLAASLSKTTAAWSVGTGNGCLDSGAIGTNTWYHFYVILRPDTGVVEGLCSLSATTPTLPANYTKARRIGAGRTNGSSQWITFSQIGDEFLWDAAVLDVTDDNPGTSAILSTMTVPTGIKVTAILNQVLVTGAGGASAGLVSSPDSADAAASLTALPLANIYAPASSASSNRIQIRTNTSAQVRRRLSFSDADVDHHIATIGWLDRRGKDS